MKNKNMNLKNSAVLKVTAVILIAILCAFLVELIANIKLFSLPDEKKGTFSCETEEVVFSCDDISEGRPEDNFVYKTAADYSGYEGNECVQVDVKGYVDKLVIEHDNFSASYFDIIVVYRNSFDFVESKVVKDHNPVYLRKSIVNINKNVEKLYIIPVANSTPGIENAPQVLSVSVQNVARLNIFVMLFTFMAVLCVGLIIIFRKTITTKIEYGFLIIALCAGITFTIIMPLSRVVWDEESHFLGVYMLDVRGGFEWNNFLHGFIGGSYDANFPFEYSQSIEEYENVVDTINRLSVPSESDPAVYQKWGTSNFATFSYVFMAITCNICKLLGLPLSLTYVLVRMTNLFMYIMVIFFAVRKLPKGKLLMSAIALLPTPMFLACGISYDTIVTGFIYLGFAYLFAMMLNDKKSTVWEYLVYICAFGYGSSRKAIYIPLILLGLILPHRCFKDRKTEKWMKAGIVAVFVIMMSTFILPELISPITEGDLRGGNTSHVGQMGSVFSHIFVYAGILLSSIWKYLFEFGVGEISLDHFAYMGSGTLIYLIVIYLVTLTLTSENTVYAKNEKNKWVSKEMPLIVKILLFFLIFVVVCLIWTSMYLSYTEVGKMTIAGVQGRYYIPLLFPVLFLLSFNRVNVNWDKQKYNLIGLLLSAFIIFYTVAELVLVKCCL